MQPHGLCWVYRPVGRSPLAKRKVYVLNRMNCRKPEAVITFQC